MATPAMAPSRLFGDENYFVADLFTFPVRDVLLRAAHRRNREERGQVSPTDFLAGLVRCGQLTRHVLVHFGISPDELYAQLLPPSESSEEESEASANATNAQPEDPEVLRERLRKLIQKWIVRDRGEFDELLLRWLDHADMLALRGGDASLISERDVLMACLEQGCWTLDAKLAATLPSPAAVCQWLEKSSNFATMDENGELTLGDLNPSARQIVERAHELAQQRGAREIGHRIFLAAFLAERDGPISQACRRLGCDSRRLSALLVASTDSDSPATFLLTADTAGTAVLSAIDAAQARQGKLLRNRFLFVNCSKRLSWMCLHPSFAVTSRRSPSRMELTWPP